MKLGSARSKQLMSIALCSKVCVIPELQPCTHIQNRVWASFLPCGNVEVRLVEGVTGSMQTCCAVQSFGEILNHVGPEPHVLNVLC